MISERRDFRRCRKGSEWVRKQATQMLCPIAKLKQGTTYTCTSYRTEHEYLVVHVTSSCLIDNCYNHNHHLFFHSCQAPLCLSHLRCVCFAFPLPNLLLFARPASALVSFLAFFYSRFITYIMLKFFVFQSIAGSFRFSSPSG